MIRTIVYGGLYWGPLISGNYHIDLFGHCTAFCLRKLRPLKIRRSFVEDPVSGPEDLIIPCTGSSEQLPM